MNKNLSQIKFYGGGWCGDCKRSKAFLDENKVRYDYIDLGENPHAAAIVEKINNGHQSIPTIVFPNGTVLVEPSNDELKKAVIDNKNDIVNHSAENIRDRGDERNG